MAQATTPRSIELVQSLRPLWWYGAITFFVVGDLATTFVGLQLQTVAEASPVAAWVINSYGIGAVLPPKMGVFAFLYGLSRIVPQPHSIGVPLGLCALGVAVTAWNSAVIASALT